MLKILDKNSKVKFVLLDDADEPVKVDELVIKEANKEKEKEVDASTREAS